MPAATPLLTARNGLRHLQEELRAVRHGCWLLLVSTINQGADEDAPVKARWCLVGPAASMMMSRRWCGFPAGGTEQPGVLATGRCMRGGRAWVERALSRGGAGGRAPASPARWLPQRCRTVDGSGEQGCSAPAPRESAHPVRVCRGSSKQPGAAYPKVMTGCLRIHASLWGVCAARPLICARGPMQRRGWCI
jgi:hypothetical protein